MTLKSNNILKESFFKKYRNIIYKKTDYKKRYILQNKLFELRTNNKLLKKHNCLSCKYFENKSIWKIENVTRFYKKFNVHLQLKQSYDLKLIPNSNKEACLQSYLIFLSKIYYSKKFNNIQKLNTILKINDLVVLKFWDQYLNLDLNHSKNFFFEKKLIKNLI